MNSHSLHCTFICTSRHENMVDFIREDAYNFINSEYKS